MLLILFQIGETQFGLQADNILEIIPAIPLKSFPQAHAAIVGFFNYRGALIPVIDMGLLLNNLPSKKFLSTRIALMSIEVKENEANIFGLMAEKMTDILTVDSGELKQPAINSIKSPKITAIVEHENQSIHCIDSTSLLTPEIQSVFFTSKLISSRSQTNPVLIKSDESHNPL